MRGASGATDPFDERPTPVGLELDGSYPMHNHHACRGGLFAVGIGIVVMSTIAPAGAGSPGVSAAPAAGRAVVTAAVADVEAFVATIAPTVEQAEPDGNEPERPVVHAGPGPATPVEGATTLIDPLVIERVSA